MYPIKTRRIFAILGLSVFIQSSAGLAEEKADGAHYIKALVDQAEAIRRYDVVIKSWMLSKAKDARHSSVFPETEETTVKRVVLDLDAERVLYLEAPPSRRIAPASQLTTQPQWKSRLQFFDAGKGYNQYFSSPPSAIESFDRLMRESEIPLLG